MNLILSPITALITYYEETPGAYGDMQAPLNGPLHAWQQAVERMKSKT